MLFEHKITIREIADAILVFGARHKFSLMFYGNSGIGKSEKIQQAANEMTKDIDISWQKTNFIDFRLCFEAVESLGGLWVPQDDVNTAGIKLTKAMPEIWEEVFVEGWAGIILLDELSSAIPSKQSIAYQFLNERVLGGRKISENAVIVGAGNMQGSGGLTFDLLKPVANRVMQFEIEDTGIEATNVWVEDYAYIHNVHPAIISYVKEHPQNLNKNTEDSNCPAFPSQRSYAKASLVLHDMDNGITSNRLGWIGIGGVIGEIYASELKIHYELGFKLPKATNILKGLMEVMPEEYQTTAAQNYIMYSVAGLWKQYFMAKEYTDEDLFKALDFAVGWFQNNLHSSSGTEKDLMIGFGLNIKSFVEKNAREFGRSPSFALDMINNTKTYKAICMEVMKLKALAAS